MIKIEKIKNFVHALGRWQDESCYKTIIEVYKGSIFIYNKFLYGTKEEQEICHDLIVINRMTDGISGQLVSMYIGELSSHIFFMMPELFDGETWSQPKIDITGWEKL